MDRDTLLLYQRRIRADIAHQARYHERWQRAIQLFDTSYWDSLKEANPELVEVNYSTTFITTLVSAVFARAPRWRIEAKRPGKFFQMAQTMQVLMEQFKEEAKLKDLGIKCVVDAATCNIGWIEQGFYAGIDQPTPQLETGSDEPGMMRRMGQLLSRLTQETPALPAAKGELHQQKLPGQFYLLRRSPWDVIVPAGCYEYESLPYLTVRTRMFWEDFLNSPRFEHQDRYGSLLPAPGARKLGMPSVRGAEPGSVYNHRGSPGSKDRDPDRQVDLYTIWDRRANQHFTLSLEADKAHEEPSDWPYLGEGFPQKPLQFNYVPEIPDERDNFYGFADLDPIMAQVLEKSDLRTQQSMIRRRAIVKVFVQEGSATETQMMKLQSPDIEVIPVQNIQSIVVSPPIQIPQAVLQTEDMIDRDLSRESGLALLISDTSQLQGIQRSTVANLASQGATIKTSYKIDRIEAWIKAIGVYQVVLYWQYLTSEEVAERLGHIPSPQEWIPLPSDLALAREWAARELLLQVEAGSTKPMNADVIERDQYFKSLAIIQATDPGLYAQISRQAIAIGVKKFNEPALEQLVLQAMDQESAQAAMGENQLMLQGHPQIVEPHEDHQTHMKVHMQAADHPIVAAHMQAHQVRMQELAQGQKTAGQGVRQENASPSPAEIGQGGHPSGTDIGGAAMKGGSPASDAQQNA